MDWNFTVKDIAKYAIPVWSGVNWFVCCYLIFMCFVPFINSFLKILSSGRYLTLLSLNYFLFIFIPALNLHGNTYSKMWGISTPAQASSIIAEQRKTISDTPKNLEEQAISLVGTDIYQKLIKGYTEKQWGRDCKELPAFIIRRLPVRYTYDNNYFNDRYQGIPVGGYNRIIENLLDGIDTETGADFNTNRAAWEKMANTIIYTGAIDEYFGYELGQLEYRGLRFETERLEEENHQGVAVMNYTDRETPYTRIIEHKHFEFGKQPVTYITKEYPCEWKPGDEAYYPVNDIRNQELYAKYKMLAKKEKDVIFGGRLGEYKYYDMDKVIEQALVYSKSF